VVDVAIAPDGRTVITGGDDWHAVRWSADSGDRLARFSGHVARIERIAIARQAQFVATLGADDTVRVWEPNTGAQLARFALPPGRHKLLDFAGSRILVGADSGLLVFDCEPCRDLPALRQLANDRLAALTATVQPTGDRIGAQR
jgi:WD40 repeat protein